MTTTKISTYLSEALLVCSRTQRAVGAGIEGELAELSQDAKRLEDRIALLEASVKGFFWMIEEQVLVRDIASDAQPGWMYKVMKFTRWLAAVYDLVHRDNWGEPVETDDLLKMEETPEPLEAGECES